MTESTRPGCPDPELLTALVDDELDLTARDTVLSHIASCADCRAELDLERRTRATVRGLAGPDVAPSPELLLALRAIPRTAGPAAVVTAPAAPAPVPVPDVPAVASLDEHRAARSGRAPAFLGAAASVVVFMVGAFAFLGATGPGSVPEAPTGGVAIVPAADRLTMEHAATNAQTSLGGPGVTTVSVNLPVTTPTAVPQ